MTWATLTPEFPADRRNFLGENRASKDRSKRSFRNNNAIPRTRLDATCSMIDGELRRYFGMQIAIQIKPRHCSTLRRLLHRSPLALSLLDFV